MSYAAFIWRKRIYLYNWNWINALKTYVANVKRYAYYKTDKLGLTY